MSAPRHEFYERPIPGCFCPYCEERRGVSSYAEKMISKELDLSQADTQEHFATGAVRDSQEGKARFDLVPTESLRRLAHHYERALHQYPPGNWEHGIPFKRVIASLLRHVYDYMQRDEKDHPLEAIAWAAFTLMAYEERIRAGKLPKDLDNRD